MTDLCQRLRSDAKDHFNVAFDCDCRPEDTANWQHAANCNEAADRIEALERQLLANNPLLEEAADTIDRLRDVLSTLCNRIELEGATPLDWPAFRAARAALGE